MDQAERLRQMVQQNMNQSKPSDNTSHARIITVTSGKGGVGKSSLAINLALMFRKMGKRVIIFDADFGLANIEVMFGVIPQYTLADIMFKGKELKDVITQGPEGVMFISGGSGIARLVNLDVEQIKRLVSKMSELDNLADIVIVDTGAGISSSVLEFVAASPEVVLVATPEPTSITDSYALLKALKMFPGYEPEHSRIMLMGNKTNSAKEGVNLYEKLSSVVTRFLGLKMEYIGSVPMDEAVVKAVMKQSPVSTVYPNSSSSRAYKLIMDNLNHTGDVANKEKTGLGKFFNNVLKHNNRF